MNDRIVVEVVHGGHEAVLELLFGGDADVAQNRTREQSADDRVFSCRLGAPRQRLDTNAPETLPHQAAEQPVQFDSSA